MTIGLTPLYIYTEHSEVVIQSEYDWSGELGNYVQQLYEEPELRYDMPVPAMIGDELLEFRGHILT